MRRRDLMIGGLAVATVTGARAEPGPVVLELFTSQGCSSCPPADALLGELSRRPSVIGLAWHVDYWNNLGWRDPYASRQWTDRQRQYARLLNDEVYTPALVINGAAMVVGSDRAAVASAIADAGALPVPVRLTRDDAGLTLDLGPVNRATSVLLAVYDPRQATAVGAGENAGRRLHDYRIVRAVRTLAAEPGRVSLSRLGAGQGAAVLVQDANGRILGAADTSAPDT